MYPLAVIVFMWRKAFCMFHANKLFVLYNNRALGQKDIIARAFGQKDIITEQWSRKT